VTEKFEIGVGDKIWYEAKIDLGINFLFNIVWVHPWS
jgi:hypothetical protein